MTNELNDEQLNLLCQAYEFLLSLAAKKESPAEIEFGGSPAEDGNKHGPHVCKSDSTQDEAERQKLPVDNQNGVHPEAEPLGPKVTKDIDSDG